MPLIINLQPKFPVCRPLPYQCSDRFHIDLSNIASGRCARRLTPDFLRIVYFCCLYDVFFFPMPHFLVVKHIFLLKTRARLISDSYITNLVSWLQWSAAASFIVNNEPHHLQYTQFRNCRPKPDILSRSATTNWYVIETEHEQERLYW